MRNTAQHSLLLAILLGATACGGAKASYAPSERRGPPQTVAAERAPAPTHRRAPVATGSQSVAADSASAERYETVPENRYQEAAQSAVSTFSIDVDTASYSNVRRYLRGNQLPPSSAVRIEEFVNYFGYDYAGPADSQPFAIHTEVSDAPWAAQHQLVKIGLQGTRMETSELPKRNLVFLIDVSGSMSSHNKLPLLKQGFLMLTKTMREEDRVSIVVYAGAAGAVLLPTSGAEQETIQASIDRLQSGGSTNGGQGIELAYKLAEENFDPDAINRVILASDGDFNVGMTNKQALIELIEKKRKSGVYLSVLGFGSGNLNDATMEQIADKGNGNYSYIDSAAEARKVLVDEGGSTLVTIAKDVMVQVEFNTDLVESYRLIGYENRMLENEDFENDQADAGELGPGHSVTALYEIVRKASAAQGTLVDVRLRYKRPDASESQLLAHDVETQSKRGERASEDMRFATAVAGFGLLLKKSQHRGSLTWSQLQAMAEDAVGSHQSPHRREFLELVRIARRLAGPERQIAN